MWSSRRATSTSQSATTPPPCPPRAATVRRIGRSFVFIERRSLDGERETTALTAPLRPANDRSAYSAHEPVPAARIDDYIGAIEGRTECRRVRDFPAHAAADAAVVDMGNGITS